MQKLGCFFFFSKTVIFLEFQSIEAVFRLIKIDSKFLSEPLSVSIDRTYGFDQSKIVWDVF